MSCAKRKKIKPLCDQWEHKLCIQLAERPTKSMYQALMENRSKAILDICTQSRNVALLPSVFVNKTWNMNAHAKSGWPARALSEAHEQMQRAGVHHREERSRMQQQITKLHNLLRTLGSNITALTVQLNANLIPAGA